MCECVIRTIFGFRPIRIRMFLARCAIFEIGWFVHFVAIRFPATELASNPCMHAQRMGSMHAIRVEMHCYWCNATTTLPLLLSILHCLPSAFMQCRWVEFCVCSFPLYLRCVYRFKINVRIRCGITVNMEMFEHGMQQLRFDASEATILYLIISVLFAQCSIIPVVFVDVWHLGMVLKSDCIQLIGEFCRSFVS